MVNMSNVDDDNDNDNDDGESNLNGDDVYLG